MSLETFLLFLPACFALNMAPGPNNLLSIANGTRHGFMKACLAGTGRLAAFTGMIALAASGLAAILQAAAWLLARQEFLVAAGNPKAILIFTAFLPQFVDMGRPVASQFLVLGSAFLVLEWLAIAAYAYMGSHLRQWFSAPARKRAFNRSCASLLGCAGVGLLLSRRGAS